MNRQSHSSGKSLFLQINEHAHDLRELNPYPVLCAWNVALILYKSTLELNKIMDSHHTSYMVYGALTLLIHAAAFVAWGHGNMW